MKTLLGLLLALASLGAQADAIKKEKVVIQNQHFELTVGQVEEFLSSQYRMPLHLTHIVKRPFISTLSEIISLGQSRAYFRVISFEGTTADGRLVRATCDLDIGFPMQSDLSVDECFSEDAAFKDAFAPLSDFANVN